MNTTRRQFLTAAAALPAARVLSAGVPAAAAGPRKKIALLGTVVRKHSHAQHFIDRFLLGYGWRGEWRKPEVDLVSLYIDQFPDNDLARDTAKRHNVPIYKSIADALTLGTGRLAVDGVVIIGEHGSYPKSEMGQTLYPRYQWFKEIVKVFESAGRSVPVFNDKHLSTKWKECAEMVADAKRLGFQFLAGSSLPVTWRLPSIDVPWGTPLVETVSAGYGGVDSYDFHGLETAQCMSERRQGGEVGIKSVHALRGAKMWEKLAAREHTKRLLVSALSRSNNLPGANGYPSDVISFDWARKTFPDGLGYFIEHRDGFHTTFFLLPVSDFTCASLRRDNNEVIACQMHLPMPGHGATTADFFNPLIHHIERMVIENRAPYPVERTLLTSGMTLAAVESQHRGQVLIETPDMAVRYEAPKEPLFWTD